VYHLHVDRLRQLRPDVILTCLQAAHGAVLHAELLHAALEAALDYVPKVCSPLLGNCGLHAASCPGLGPCSGWG
jgi:hypothetical protein